MCVTGHGQQVYTCIYLDVDALMRLCVARVCHSELCLCEHVPYMCRWGQHANDIHVRTCMYRILPSKRTSPCKRPPPFFDDPMVRVYIHYTYKWLLRVNPPFFGP